MKASRATNSFFAALSALALLGTVALTGCSSSALTGPDAAPGPQVEAVEGGNGTNATDDQNGGGTDNGASFNTMPRED